MQVAFIRSLGWGLTSTAGALSQAGEAEVIRVRLLRLGECWNRIPQDWLWRACESHCPHNGRLHQLARASDLSTLRRLSKNYDG